MIEQVMKELTEAVNNLTKEMGRANWQLDVLISSKTMPSEQVVGIVSEIIPAAPVVPVEPVAPAPVQPVEAAPVAPVAPAPVQPVEPVTHDTLRGLLPAITDKNLREWFKGELARYNCTKISQVPEENLAELYTNTKAKLA